MDYTSGESTVFGFLNLIIWIGATVVIQIGQISKHWKASESSACEALLIV